MDPITQAMDEKIDMMSGCVDHWRDRAKSCRRKTTAAQIKELRKIKLRLGQLNREITELIAA